MSLTQILNGVHVGLNKRDDQIFKIVARELKLDDDALVRLKDTVYGELEKGKSSPIKPQKRQPKNISHNGNATRKGKKSPYSAFQSAKWDEVTQMLIKDPGSRKFVSRTGAQVEIDPSEFHNGSPKLEHVTKKISSMWAEISVEGKKKWAVEEMMPSVQPKDIKAKEPVSNGSKGKKSKTEPLADGTASASEKTDETEKSSKSKSSTKQSTVPKEPSKAKVAPKK